MRSGDRIPSPRNPYGVGIAVLGLLIVVGVVLIFKSGIGTVGRPVIGLLLPGIMLVTMAAIFLFGALFGWRGFEKRFGRESLLGYWEIAAGEWREHLEGEKKKLIKLGLFGGLGIPGVALGVMLILAYSDGKLDEIRPVSLVVAAGIAIVILIVVLIQWFSLSGNQGCVWLAKRGIVINRVVFFIDGFGMRTLSRELRHQDGKHLLSIHYQIQGRSGRIDKELLVPVPEEKLELVEEALEEWNCD